MHYLGGKSRIAKDLASFLESQRTVGQAYLEPFVGGASVLTAMSGQRFAGDSNESLITLYVALQKGWQPPEEVSEEKYAEVKRASNPSDPLTAFCSFGCSFSGKEWGGYARSKAAPSYAPKSRRVLLAQKPFLDGVIFRACSYADWSPSGYLIYCDPPYANTTSYRGVRFDHETFWETMRLWSRTNKVFISEYESPPDFRLAAEFTYTRGMTKNGKRSVQTEKVFTLGGI